jgi:hypothetical protein
MRYLPLLALVIAASAQAQTFEPAQCSSDRICASVPLDGGTTGSINASVKAAPACSVTLAGTTYSGQCNYSAPYGYVQFSNGYSYYQDASGALCPAQGNCKAFTATFEFKQTKTVSGRLAGRVQTFWFVTGGGVQ